MGKGSVLKNLKDNLKKHDLLRHQKKALRAGDKLQTQARRERDRESLASIRDAFNPFSTKFNRNKSGNGSKEAGGRPVAARSQAEAQRKRTWEAERRLKNKVGGLVDRRFGEKDNELTDQDKMVERYAREKLNRMRKPGKSFNIEDEGYDDILTHGGLAMEFDDFQEDDLGVKEEQLSYSNTDNDKNLGETPEQSKQQPERQKTKAEVMQEVIAKSKMHKIERKQQQAHDDELIDELNAGFDDLMADLASVENTAEKKKRIADAYDANIQEFAFERRADPSDRTETAEELLQEAAKRKRAAERAQTARMEGDELDIDYDNAEDDAQLFGLNDCESQSEVDADQSEELVDGATAMAIPQTARELRATLDGADVEAKLKALFKAVVPGRGSGSQTKLYGLATALVSYATQTPEHFGAAVGALHANALKNDAGLAIANKARELVHQAHTKPEWSRRELLLFCLIGSLFSTSDQWHVVATSASLVIAKRLSQSVSAALDVVATNLFLCDVLLTYQRLSKRYIPEVSGYFLRVLSMLNPINREIGERHVRISSKKMECGNVSTGVLGHAKIGEPAESPEEVAVIVAKLVSKAASLWRSMDAFSEVFTPLHSALSRIPSSNKSIDESVAKLQKLIHFSRTERKSLQLQQFRPIGIITHAPLFDENYNPEAKGVGMDPERRELQKLKAMHKKERKSTLREIRRDAEFDARQNLVEKRTQMAAYHDKLKQIEGQINGEEGAERNAYERERKRRRK